MRFVRTRRYIKDMKRIGASEAEMTVVEQLIASSPTHGDVVQGLGGVRKMRFGIGGRGKRGGGRALYFLMLSDDTAIMLTAYMKNERSDLSQSDRKAIGDILKELNRDK